MRRPQLGSTSEEFLVVVIFFAIIFVVAGGFSYFTGSAKCSNRWERSGLQSDYKFMGGCMVRRKDGTWVPAENLRDVSLDGGTR